MGWRLFCTLFRGYAASGPVVLVLQVAHACGVWFLSGISCGIYTCPYGLPGYVTLRCRVGRVVGKLRLDSIGSEVDNTAALLQALQHHVVSVRRARIQRCLAEHLLL